jgi:N-acetyl-gamma-glutamyl-phosphate reductase
VVAASGTSGAGRKPTESLLASQVMGSMSAYKVGGVHQHTPEIEQQLSLAAGGEVRVSFTPLLAPMSRGIISTCTAQVLGGVTESDLRDALHGAYDAEAFVQLLAPGTWPQTSSVSGSNLAQLQVSLDAHSGRVVIVSVIDNLGKGAAGQALQNANIITGLPEGAGLSTNGVAP